MTTNPSPEHTPGIIVLGRVSPAAAVAAPGPWASQALCADAEPRMFFPAYDDPATEARQICARCPVRADCLTYALDSSERYGIWGGLDPRERDNLRRRRHRRQPQPGNGKGPA